MAYRKHPTYVRKARHGYQLQRGVPKDIQPVIGKTIWVEAAGSTYREAQRLSPAFAAKTDRLIAEARNEVLLTEDELIDAVPRRFDLSDPDVVELLLTGSDVDVAEGRISLEQQKRFIAFVNDLTVLQLAADAAERTAEDRVVEIVSLTDQLTGMQSKIQQSFKRYSNQLATR